MAIASVRRTPSHVVAVVAVVELTPRMRRITMAGPTLRELRLEPAQDIELILTEESGRRIKRRYTVRAARPEVGELDIDALVHPHGPGGRWAGVVRAGDGLEFLGPRGHLQLRPAGWHLFVGDEAALPAFAALIEALPPHERATVLAEVGDPADELELVRERGALAVTWLHRRDSAPGAPELLAAALTELRPPAEPGHAYLLGESRAMVALRPVVEALGIPAERTYLKGYWNVGRGARRIPS